MTRRPPTGEPVGPGSRLWGIANDPRSLLPGPAAGILPRDLRP
jgi:uncharacterized protein (DUF2236 family)